MKERRREKHIILHKKNGKRVAIYMNFLVIGIVLCNFIMSKRSHNDVIFCQFTTYFTVWEKSDLCSFDINYLMLLRYYSFNIVR